MENLGYLLAAFIIIWAVLFVYLFVLSARGKQLRREMDSLKREIADRGTK